MGPLAVMQTEHDEGRALVRSMGDAFQEMESGNENAVPEFCRSAREFSALLRGHIMKEDHILFVMADMRLPEEEKEKLTSDFMAAEASGEACRLKSDLLRTLERLEREIINQTAAIRP